MLFIVYNVNFGVQIVPNNGFSLLEKSHYLRQIFATVSFSSSEGRLYIGKTYTKHAGSCQLGPLIGRERCHQYCMLILRNDKYLRHLHSKIQLNYYFSFDFAKYEYMYI